LSFYHPVFDSILPFYFLPFNAAILFLSFNIAIQFLPFYFLPFNVATLLFVIRYCHSIWSSNIFNRFLVAPDHFKRVFQLIGWSKSHYNKIQTLMSS
jgi:hypothetical protein